jgi:hypothetical protein
MRRTIRKPNRYPFMRKDNDIKEKANEGTGPRWNDRQTQLKPGSYNPAHLYIKWLKGLWPEDYSNDWDTQHYYHPRELKQWYAKTEVRKATEMLREAQKQQCDNNDAGLHPLGDGPFERELERKGVQVDKYPLPSTTMVMRMHEMVYLRRKAMEKKSTEVFQKQKTDLGYNEEGRVEKPSEWFDESKGPLNPHFLQFAQSSYVADVVDLPRTPQTYQQYLSRLNSQATTQ